MFEPQPTPGQQEFNDLVVRNGAASSRGNSHPEDRHDSSPRGRDSNLDLDLSEEEVYRATQIEAAMRLPSIRDHNGVVMNLPDASFDSGHSTGVKGVIADARSYQAAKKNSSVNWRSRVQTARRSIFGMDGAAIPPPKSESSETDEEPGSRNLSGSPPAGYDEDTFLSRWRDSRRKELENEVARKQAVNNRRTSPSVRGWGRMDEVDALGYLDAIEKVRRDVVVVVLVADPECAVSATIEAALRPLVLTHPAVHFVKVSYNDIDFDPAAVPALLGYTNQGDLFANLTGVVEMIPEDEDFDTETLRKVLRQHKVLP